MLLSLEEREAMIFFLHRYGKYDLQYLESLNDEQLMELEAEMTEDVHV